MAHWQNLFPITGHCAYGYKVFVLSSSRKNFCSTGKRTRLLESRMTGRYQSRVTWFDINLSEALAEDWMSKYVTRELHCSVYFYMGAHDYPMLDPSPRSNYLEQNFLSGFEPSHGLKLSILSTRI